MKVLTLGKLSQNKDEAKATIEKLGGKLTGSATKASLCISTKSKFRGSAPLRCASGLYHCSLEVKLGFVLDPICSQWPLSARGMALGSFVARMEVTTL